ncbi:MAG: 4-demethylwyosine synthase TYW1 [Candidatus Nanohaloarchaeota archaeon]|nr:4-demethylwyosine synthase TYW1 [Candidatus Nanohaloarchaeota archaeon]
MTSELAIPFEIKVQLKKKKYGIAGQQGAVQICSWTKKALKKEAVCYKNKFYGIDTHRCAEVTPLAMLCSQNCIFCWRPMEFMKFKEPSREEVDPPEKLIESLLKERKKLLSGFKGNEAVDEALLKEAQHPTHWAISLSGEPTLYPRLAEMIKLLKEKYGAETVFVVSNGMHPERFREMYELRNAMPSQIYISIDAPTKELFKKINRSVYEDGWERLHKTLEILSKLPVRKVARLTLIKGLNDSPHHMKDFADLFVKGNFDFIEIKAYMWLGYSRRRLKMENMPTHEEVREYARKLLHYLPHHKFEDEVKMSRIVLIKNQHSPFPTLLRERSPSLAGIPYDKA